MNKQDMLEQLTQNVMCAIEDKKGLDPVIIDVRGRSSVTDRFIIASGKTERQIKALAHAVSEVAHLHGMQVRIEGLEASEWLLLDLGDVLVHLFLPDVREAFHLERLWAAPCAEGQSRTWG